MAYIPIKHVATGAIATILDITLPAWETAGWVAYDPAEDAETPVENGTEESGDTPGSEDESGVPGATE